MFFHRINCAEVTYSHLSILYTVQDKVLPLPSHAPSESALHFSLPSPVKFPTDDHSQSGAPSYQPALISRPSLHPSQSLAPSIPSSATMNIDFEPTLPTSTTISSLPSVSQSQGASAGPSYHPTPTSPPTISDHPTPSIIGLWVRLTCAKISFEALLIWDRLLLNNVKTMSTGF